MHKIYDENNQVKMNFKVTGIFRYAFYSLLSVVLLVSIGCSSGDDDFVLTHQGQFLDAPVRGLDYVCGEQSGVTDKDGMFTFERGKNITFRLGNIQIGETVPVVSGVTEGKILPDVWVFTPRMLVLIKKDKQGKTLGYAKHGDTVNDGETIQYTKNQDPVVANILRFLQTLDDDYSDSDGIDNVANGIYISDTVIKNAANFKGSLDLNLSEEEFETAAEEVIKNLTGGEYRPLIPKLSAQHHFMVQLIKNEVDNALNYYASPGITMSVETPCPCSKEDSACIESGVVDGVVSYDAASHAYIWDFAAGYADVENKRPMTIDTRFRICSLTKSFVAMTILKLVEKGTISYNDPVSKHLKTLQFPTSYDTSQITIARVMNHSAGIPNYYIVPEDPTTIKEGDGEWFYNFLFHPETTWSREQIVELVKKQLDKGPSFPPEQGWGYSNTGYTILGLMIEDITKKSWEQVMREEILTPYELTDTIIPELGEASISKSVDDSTFATYYTYDPNPTKDYAYGYINLYGITQKFYGNETDNLIKRDEQEPSFLNSAGSMLSTAPNLRSWIKLIANIGDKEEGLFGEKFSLWNDSTIYNGLFFELYPNTLKVGANVYHNIANNRYIISGNSTGYDVNTTYDIDSKIAVGACANRTFDEGDLPESSGPDIWRIPGEHIQVKDVLVFKTLDILTR